MSSTGLVFESNGLYILLSDRGDTYTFHWGFYIATSATEGYVAHLLNAPNSTSWVLEIKQSSTAIYSRALLGALKIGVLDPELHQPFLQRLKEIPLKFSSRFNEDMTCRVFVKEGLYVTDEEGYIKLIKSVEKIEGEATRVATSNKMKGQKSVVRSAGSMG